MEHTKRGYCRLREEEKPKTVIDLLLYYSKKAYLQGADSMDELYMYGPPPECEACKLTQAKELTK